MNSSNRDVSLRKGLGRSEAFPFSRQFLSHALRVMAPTLIALTFASAAHAQGTMDFSGAQTLMGTFKTSALDLGRPQLFVPKPTIELAPAPQKSQAAGLGLAL